MRFRQTLIALSLLAVQFALAVPVEESQAAGALQQAGAEHAGVEAAADVHAADNAEISEATEATEATEAAEDVAETLLEEEGEVEAGPHAEQGPKASKDQKTDATTEESEDKQHGPSRPQTIVTTIHETVTLQGKDASATKAVFDDHHGCNHNIHHYAHHGHTMAPPRPSSTITATAIGSPPDPTPELIPDRWGVVTETSYTNIPSITRMINSPLATTVTERVVYKQRRSKKVYVVVYKQHVKVPSNADNFIVVLPPWYPRHEEFGFAFSWDGWNVRLKYWVKLQNKIFARSVLKSAHARGKKRAIELARKLAGGRRLYSSYNQSGHRAYQKPPRRRPYIPRPQY